MKIKNALSTIQFSVIYGAVSQANLSCKGSEIQSAVDTFGKTGKLPQGIKTPKGWDNTLQSLGINVKGGGMGTGGRKNMDTTGVLGVNAAFHEAHVITSMIADKIKNMGPGADGFIKERVTKYLDGKVTGVTFTGDDIPTMGGNSPWDGALNTKTIKNQLQTIVAAVTEKCLQSHVLCNGVVNGQQKAYGKTFAMGFLACLASDQGFTVTAFKTDITGLNNDGKVADKARVIKKTVFSGFSVTSDQMMGLQNGQKAADKIIAAINKGTPAAIYCKKPRWSAIPVDQKVIEKINTLTPDIRKTVLRELSVKTTDSINNHAGTTVAVTMKDLDTVINAVNTMGTGSGVNVRNNGQTARA